MVLDVPGSVERVGADLSHVIKLEKAPTEVHEHEVFLSRVIDGVDLLLVLIRRVLHICSNVGPEMTVLLGGMESGCREGRRSTLSTWWWGRTRVVLAVSPVPCSRPVVPAVRRVHSWSLAERKKLS